MLICIDCLASQETQIAGDLWISCVVLVATNCTMDGWTDDDDDMFFLMMCASVVVIIASEEPPPIIFIDHLRQLRIHLEEIAAHPGRGVVPRRPYCLLPYKPVFDTLSNNTEHFRRMVRLTLPQFTELAEMLGPEIIKPRNIHGHFSAEENDARRMRPCKSGATVHDRLIVFLLYLAQENNAFYLEWRQQWSKSSVVADFHHIASCIIKVCKWEVIMSV